jgi:restriction system protein
MSAGVWSLIGLAIVGLGVYLLIAVFSAIGRGARGAARGLDRLILHWLGHGRLRIRAAIPKELEPAASPLPKGDPEREELERYIQELWQSVESAPGPRPPTKRFSSRLSRLFPQPTAADDEIDVARVPQVTVMPERPPYAALRGLVESGSAYPVPAPVPSTEISPPPGWSPWRIDFPEPSLHLPLWRKSLRGLNGFVLAAYQPERERLSAAITRRADLLRIAEARNGTVAKLAHDALAAYAAVRQRHREAFQRASEEWRKAASEFETAAHAEQRIAKELIADTKQGGERGLLRRIEVALASSPLPGFFPREGETRFNSESGIVIHDHRFPDPGAVEWVKFVELKSGLTKRPANLHEKKVARTRLFPSMCIRLASEIARLDEEGIVKAIVINGWADYTDRSSGHTKRAYCASLFATKEQVLGLNLAAIDPVAAFAALKGIAAQSLELTPIAPIVKFDKDDPRFIDPKEVLSKLSKGENLATMDWEDFEHLCRELFERAFAASGAEVKVTQASRDQGVDAVVFDPDPLRGGKIVIQAKRYTNTVDVSAVRDLYGAVINEGAIKGILVTTSQYGPESYAFAKDKPLTLLRGEELLGLLAQHGYQFRIDLAEARARL